MADLMITDWLSGPQHNGPPQDLITHLHGYTHELTEPQSFCLVLLGIESGTSSIPNFRRIGLKLLP